MDIPNRQHHNELTHVCAHPHPHTRKQHTQRTYTCAHTHTQQTACTTYTCVHAHRDTPTACTTCVYMCAHTGTLLCTRVPTNVLVDTHKHAHTKQTCMYTHVQTRAHTCAHRERVHRALTTCPLPQPCPRQAQTEGLAGSQCPGHDTQSFRRSPVFGVSRQSPHWVAVFSLTHSFCSRPSSPGSWLPPGLRDPSETLPRQEWSNPGRPSYPTPAHIPCRALGATGRPCPFLCSRFC